MNTRKENTFYFHSHAAQSIWLIFHINTLKGGIYLSWRAIVSVGFLDEWEIAEPEAFFHTGFDTQVRHSRWMKGLIHWSVLPSTAEGVEREKKRQGRQARC